MDHWCCKEDLDDVHSDKLGMFPRTKRGKSIDGVLVGSSLEGKHVVNVIHFCFSCHCLETCWTTTGVDMFRLFDMGPKLMSLKHLGLNPFILGLTWVQSSCVSYDSRLMVIQLVPLSTSKRQVWAKKDNPSTCLVIAAIPIHGPKWHIPLDRLFKQSLAAEIPCA